MHTYACICQNKEPGWVHWIGAQVNLFSNQYRNLSILITGTAMKYLLDK